MWRATWKSLPAKKVRLALTTLSVAGIMGVLAAVVLARRAARLNVLEAISYE